MVTQISYGFQAGHLAFSVCSVAPVYRYTCTVNYQLAMVPGRPPNFQSWGQ